MAEPNHRQTEVYVEPENQRQSREPARRSPGRQVVFQNDRDNCDNRSRSRHWSCITDWTWIFLFLIMTYKLGTSLHFEKGNEM